MTSSANAEPKGSEPSSTDLRCRCGHPRSSHAHGASGCIGNRNLCPCQGFACDHSRCGWKPREEPRCEGCGHTEGEGCGCDTLDPREGKPLGSDGQPFCVCEHECQKHFGDMLGCHGFRCECRSYRPDSVAEEPPMTPEEEEQAPEDEGHSCDNCEGIDPGTCLMNPDRILGLPHTAEPPPPQPERRPPLRVGYSVQGHLYEVALPGDASVFAVDGGLIIKHNLGPVAGICYVQPMEGEGA